MKKNTIRNPFRRLFRNASLLKAALTHPSHRSSHATPEKHNFQRLEFLGDAVLGLIICHKLFKEMPQAQEGELSYQKSHGVSKRELSQLALAAGLERWVLVSGQKKGHHTNPKILADSFEALIGALYLDRGLKPTQHFLEGVLKKNSLLASPKETIKNPKGKLQELVQKNWKELPRYQIIVHQKGFRATVHIPSGQAFGIARSKKEAEEAAASKMLPRLEKILSKKIKKRSS